MRTSPKLAVVLGFLTAGVLAPVTVQAQAPKEASSGHRIAVVDVAHIFKNHAGIKAQVAKVENELKTYDGVLTEKRDALRTEAEKLKTFNPGTPDYAQQEELVASMESKLRLEMARKRKELSDAEARIYFDNYQKITEAVSYLAEYYKINLVLRYNSEEMSLEQSESVVRGVMKNVVYHDPGLDMTQGVMQYLDKKIASAKR